MSAVAGPDAVVVEIRGEIDPSNSDELGKELLGVMPGYRGVVLDLADVAYSDGGVVALLLLIVQQELAGRDAPLSAVIPAASPIRPALLVAGSPPAAAA